MATYGTETAHMVDPKDPEKWRKSCAAYSDPAQRDLCLSTATADGKEGKFVPPGLIQRSIVDPKLEWRVSLVNWP